MARSVLEIRSEPLRAVIETPIGPLVAGFSQSGALTELTFTRKRSAAELMAGAKSAPAAEFNELARQLRAYFDGTLRDFELELAPRGSQFQLAVWEQLKRIPYGTTTSYGKIAQDLGLTGYEHARAVGSANGSNPIPIIIPCHRVIGANGTLVGYGGGLDVKRALLDLESGIRPFTL